jgi:hypothetical protein
MILRRRLPWRTTGCVREYWCDNLRHRRFACGLLPRSDMRRLILLSVLVLLASFQLQAQERARIDVSKLGPQVRDKVPDFNLADQNGTQRTLQSIMGRRGAMLVFIRSADW